VDLSRADLARAGADAGQGRTDRLAKVERELQQARAEALGRTGERLQGILDRVAEMDRRLDALLDEPGASAGSDLIGSELDLRNGLRDEAMRVRHQLIVQREAVGIARQTHVVQCYPVPERRRLPEPGDRWRKP
jgi:hypothetical protein